MELEHGLLAVANEFCALTGSSTEFLQQINGAKLKVNIVGHELAAVDEGSILTRTVRLYFDSPELPVLYCISRLKKENLTPEERRLVMEGRLPIGKIFPLDIQKKNIAVSTETDAGIAALLKSNGQVVTKKEYDFFLGTREIASITEFFTYESLARVFAYNNHRQIINHFSPRNIISDENISIEYSKLPGLLAQLHSMFFTYRQQPLNCCIALKTRNNVGTAVVMLYLLAEKISFYLCADYAGDGIVPPFCDKVVSVDFDASEKDFARSVTIRENPAHRHQQAIEKGLIFLSSSGTSGPSKYVCYRQDAMLANARNCISRFRFNNTISLLVPVPVSHMFGIGVGLLPALLCGANVCLIERNNILKLFSKLGEFQPHFTLITPTVAKMVVMLNKPLPANSLYISAGEIIDKETYVEFESKYGDLVNLYGCTELGAMATSPQGCEWAEKRHEGFVLPLPGVEIKLEGDEQGEILCRHNAGFSSYVNEYGSTILKQGEWYATKDIGMNAAGGSFKIAGRVDNCINRSGFLISLEEVETELNRLFSEINHAVVLSVEDKENLLARMIAICELNDGCELDAQAALKICRREMKRHHQPDQFYFVNNIPRLRNGKPDRYSLRKTVKNW